MLDAIMLYWMRSWVLPARFMPVVEKNDDVAPELSLRWTANCGLFAKLVLTRLASEPPSVNGPIPDSKLVLEITTQSGAWQAGSPAQSLSAQSIAPSPSLSIPSVHDVSVVAAPPIATLTVNVTPLYAANALIMT